MWLDYLHWNFLFFKEYITFLAYHKNEEFDGEPTIGPTIKLKQLSLQWWTTK